MSTAHILMSTADIDTSAANTTMSTALKMTKAQPPQIHALSSIMYSVIFKVLLHSFHLRVYTVNVGILGDRSFFMKVNSATGHFF